MSDVKVQHKQALSRQEAARLIAALAEGLGEEGKVIVPLGNSTLGLSVASQLDWGLEIGVDGEEIELQLALKWSKSGRTSPEAAEGGSDGDKSDEGQAHEDVWGEGDSGHAAAEDESRAAESDENAAGRDEAESVQAIAPEQVAEPRRGRRSASAGAGKAAFNGVDSAAVRAWAAANGLPVSPRGRLKDEVIKAYRAAGN